MGKTRTGRDVFNFQIRSAIFPICRAKGCTESVASLKALFRALITTRVTQNRRVQYGAIYRSTNVFQQYDTSGHMFGCQVVPKMLPEWPSL